MVTGADRVKKSIVVYLILTFALSSLFYRLMLRQSSASHGRFFGLGLIWCPGVSGLLTRLIFQGNLRGHGFAWGKTKYQFASYCIPLIYASAVYVPIWLAGYGEFLNLHLTPLRRIYPTIPHWTFSILYFLYLATAGVVMSCVWAVGEELGWRGFLVPELAKLTSFPRVALASGAVWAVWHYPSIAFTDYHGTGPLWYSLVCFTVMIVGISFFMAWMRLKSRSVWTGMIAHASHNLFVQAWFDSQTRHARLTDLWTTEFGAGLALSAIVLAIIFYRRRGELPVVGQH